MFLSYDTKRQPTAKNHFFYESRESHYNNGKNSISKIWRQNNIFFIIHRQQQVKSVVNRKIDDCTLENNSKGVAVIEICDTAKLLEYFLERGKFYLQMMSHDRLPWNERNLRQLLHGVAGKTTLCPSTVRVYHREGNCNAYRRMVLNSLTTSLIWRFKLVGIGLEKKFFPGPEIEQT